MPIFKAVSAIPLQTPIFGSSNRAGVLGIWPKLKRAGNHSSQGTESKAREVICFGLGSVFGKKEWLTVISSEVRDPSI